MNFIACEVMFHVGYGLQVYLYTIFESKPVVIVHLAKAKKKFLNHVHIVLRGKYCSRGKSGQNMS